MYVKINRVTDDWLLGVLFWDEVQNFKQHNKTNYFKRVGEFTCMRKNSYK